MWAAKTEVFQLALFDMVKGVAEVIIAQTDNTWAKLFRAQYLVTSSAFYDAPDLISPITPVSLGLSALHRDLHLGGELFVCC